jgi:hypothetical protein
LYYRIRADKPPNGGVVVSGIIVVKAGGVKARPLVLKIMSLRGKWRKMSLNSGKSWLNREHFIQDTLKVIVAVISRDLI